MTTKTTSSRVNATTRDATRPLRRDEDTRTGTKAGRTGPARGLVTPCYGKSALFDSTDYQDHLTAKAMCARCPTLEVCMKHLRDVRANTAPYGELEGTWAGQYFDGKVVNGRLGDERSSRRRMLDEQRYTDDQARAAHRAYKNGDRTDWAVAGNKVHNRRKKCASRERAA